MKWLILSFMLLIPFVSCKTAGYQKPMLYIDERIELMNVVFRLAGIPDYQNCIVKPYAEAIDTYFAAYKEHELISVTSQLWDKYHISHDAVAKYAVILDIKDGKISFIKDTAFELGPRWQGDMPSIFFRKAEHLLYQIGFSSIFQEQC